MTCQNCGNELAPSLKFCPKCGTPASAQGYAPPVNQVQSSWSQDPQFAPTTQPQRKSRVGKVLLIIGIVLVLLVAGAGFAIYYGYRYLKQTLKSSEAYAVAEFALKESAEVKERLGEIKSTGFPIGNYEEKGNDTGHADFHMSVEGEKASGRYYVVMNRSQRKWRIEHAYVELKGGEIITVADSTSRGGGEMQKSNTNINDNSNANSNANQPRAGNSNQSKTISGGVIDGKATSKPQPPYPPAARAARAQGTVTVQVTVDEEGKVVSATAVSGHPLLQAAAVSAARQARFSPTLLSGKPVKVTGILTYKFTLEE